MKQLPHSFFDRPTVTVARELIGCYLARQIGQKIEKHIIIETEAYDGSNDKASHAARSKTKRNSIMFESAGHIYVYFTYGMHWMLNIVTGKKDYPAAVLIRGVEGTSGPARLTKLLKIDGALNGKTLNRKIGLWIEEGQKNIPTRMIKKLPRIGVDYAGPIWSKKKYRFILEKPLT
jgi:DNA-3-methyladenine glycosylase